MLLNFYQKNVEFDDIARSIVKYVMMADKGTKTFVVPLDSYMLMSIKNFRVIIKHLEYKNNNLLINFITIFKNIIK